MGHDNTIVLAGATFIAAVLVATFTYFNGKTNEYSRMTSELSSQVDKLDFLDSCDPDGRFNNRNQKNCIEREGYRIVRSGLDAIIVKIIDGKPEVIAHSSPDRRRFIPASNDDMAEITRVFSSDQPDK